MGSQTDDLGSTGVIACVCVRVCVVCLLFVCLNPVLLGTASKSATKFRAWTPCEKRRGPVRELDPEQSVRVHQSRSRRRGRSRGTERNPPAGPGRSCAAAAETKVHARLCGCVRRAPPGRARMRTRVQMPAAPASAFGRPPPNVRHL